MFVLSFSRCSSDKLWHTLRLIILCPQSFQSHGRHRLCEPFWLKLHVSSVVGFFSHRLCAPMPLMMLAATSGSWWCAVAMLMFSEGGWDASRFIRQLRLNEVFNIAWGGAFHVVDVFLTCGNTKHRTKCRKTGDTLGSKSITKHNFGLGTYKLFLFRPRIL